MLHVAALLALIGTVSVATPAVANPPLSPAGITPPEVMSDQAVSVSLRPVARRLTVPEARWDGKPGRKSWTLAAIRALRAHASDLPEIVPKDIATYCPAYPTAPRAQREAFWVGLLSSLAWHESTHRPAAVGGGGRWYGLTQILPSTARGYGCAARSGGALKDPQANLSCALRIMAHTVERDGVVSAGMRGVAADWGPFHSSRKRQDMIRWTRDQSYCQGLHRSLRPVAREDMQADGTDTNGQFISLNATREPSADQTATHPVLSTQSD
ncbi:transglycosylase SLT domain-containing protein [Sagittula sp. SSi028]|uniref:transglycosylase SLT domain-containing protein n=1 Tax=Sagittula sp. SSi028 TaxID=3400636 RepID=UPI003AF53B7F